MADGPTPTVYYPNQGSYAEYYLGHKQPGGYPNEGSNKWSRAAAAPGIGIDPRGIPDEEDQPPWTRAELIEWLEDWLGFSLPESFWSPFSDEELLVLVELLTNEETP